MILIQSLVNMLFSMSQHSTAQMRVCVCVYIYMCVCVYIEFCMGVSKQNTVLYSPYRTAMRATVLQVVIEPEVDKQF